MKKNHFVILAASDTAGKISRTLIKIGFRNHTVFATLREARTYLTEKKAHAALVELAFAGKPGAVESARILKEKHGLPVVFITVPEDRDRIGDALAAGPAAFIPRDDEAGIQGALALFTGKPAGKEKTGGIITDQTERTLQPEDLRSSERLLSSIIDFLPDATFVINRQKEVIAWNRSIEFMTGVKKKDILGKGDYAYSIAFYGKKRPMLVDIALENIDDADKLYDYLTIKNKIITAEAYVPQVFNNKGAYIWGTATPLYDENGEVIGAIESIRDITSRKNAEESLKKSEERFRNYFNLPMVGIAVISPDMKWISVNNKLCELLGYSRDELKKRTWADITPVEDIEAELQRYKGSIEQGKDISTFTKRYIRKDGSIFYAEISTACVRSSDGRPDYFITLIQDITDRLSVEQALRESEERYRSLIQNIQDGVFVVQGQKMLLFNDALSRMTGYSEKELNASDFFEFIHTPDRDIVLENYRRRQSGESIPENYEIRIRQKNGSIIHVMLSAGVININGKPATIGTLKDITDRIRTEEKLRTSEANIRALLESTDISFILIDREFRIKTFNTIAARLSKDFLGMDIKEGDEIKTYIPDRKTLKVLMNHLERAFNGERFSTERKLHTLQGHTAWFEFNYSPVYDNEGQRQGVLFNAKDITERKIAEEMLQLNQVRLETLLSLNNMIQSTYDEITGFAIEKASVLTGSTMGYLAFLEDNGKVLRMHAWSSAAMKECEVKDKTDIYPLDTTGLWGEAVRQRKPIITNDYNEPSKWKKGYPKGHVHINRHMNIPIFDGDTIIGVAGVANKENEYNETDVQQLTLLMQGMWQLLLRKNYEEALRRSEESLSTTLASIGDAIIATDTDFMITRMNPVAETLTGWSFAQAAGRPITDVLNIIDEKTAQPVPGIYLNILEKDRIVRSGGSTILLDRNGDKRRIAQSASPIRDSRGDILGIVIVFRDVTERHMLEEQLRQAQKIESIGRLAGGVAHDFNNLLTTIIGNAELAITQTERRTDSYDLLTEIHEAGRRGALLTGQLLAFSRKQMLEMKVINFNEVIRGFEQILRRLMRESIELVLELNDATRNIMGDYVQIEQILMNMTVNSIDAMPYGGTFTIKTGNRTVGQSQQGNYKTLKPGTYAALIVEDTGRGMDTATVKNIFEPFFTTKDLSKGTGLGLSTVYGIVTQHGGDIFVSSEPGRGTTFEILIPAEAQSTPVKPMGKTTAPPMGGSEIILLVEDNHEVRKLAKRFLMKMGYNVIDTDDPSSALEIGRKTPVDLLLTDVVMPGMNGKQLFEKLASQNPQLKVLYMSGYTDDIILTHGIKDDTIHFIQKPFTLDDFSQKIREAFKR